MEQVLDSQDVGSGAALEGRASELTPPTGAVVEQKPTEQLA